jgi:alpha-amylase/alpha-mannosidase (GH57 family)
MPFYLPFAVHNHQPVGNFAKVFKKATQQCYAPFLRIVKNYPSFRFSLHISGPLWEWFEENAPDLIDIIGEMVTRGQIELMAGGFYEPLLPTKGCSTTGLHR